MSAETATPVDGVQSDSTALVAVQAALTEFDKVQAGLADLKARYGAVVYDCASPKGLADALAARREIRDPRYRTEEIRKSAKAPVLALGRNIDERARYITTELLAIEMPIDQQIKVEEERRERAKREAEEKERQRIAAIDAAIEAIRARPSEAIGKASSEIVAMIADLDGLAIGESYGEQQERAQLAKDIALSKLRTARDNVAAQEAESQRMAAERAALARQRAEQDERDRLQREDDQRRRAALEAEERASRERIETQEREARDKREEADRIARIDREQREAEAKRIRDAEEARLRQARENLERQEREARHAQEERDRQARELKEQLERKAREKAEAEAAAKRASELKAQEAREAAEREERRKAAEIADGRAHLQAFVDTYGKVDQFAGMARSIAAFLTAEDAMTATVKPAGLAAVAKPRRTSTRKAA